MQSKSPRYDPIVSDAVKENRAQSNSLGYNQGGLDLQALRCLGYILDSSRVQDHPNAAVSARIRDWDGR